MSEWYQRGPLITLASRYVFPHPPGHHGSRFLVVGLFGFQLRSSFWLVSGLPVGNYGFSLFHCQAASTQVQVVDGNYRVWVSVCLPAQPNKHQVRDAVIQHASPEQYRTDKQETKKGDQDATEGVKHAAGGGDHPCRSYYNLPEQ